jgi:hypothetical protein
MLFFYQNKDREMFLADLFILPVGLNKSEASEFLQ